MLVVHGTCSQTSNTFHSLFSKKMLDIRAGIHKLFVRNANREYHDQTASKQSDLDLHCLLRTFWQATSFII